MKLDWSIWNSNWLHVISTDGTDHMIKCHHNLLYELLVMEVQEQLSLTGMRLSSWFDLLSSYDSKLLLTCLWWMDLKKRLNGKQKVGSCRVSITPTVQGFPAAEDPAEGGRASANSHRFPPFFNLPTDSGLWLVLRIHPHTDTRQPRLVRFRWAFTGFHGPVWLIVISQTSSWGTVPARITRLSNLVTTIEPCFRCKRPMIFFFKFVSDFTAAFRIRFPFAVPPTAFSPNFNVWGRGNTVSRAKPESETSSWISTLVFLLK